VTAAPAPGLTQAVELLDRSLAYTRVALADVGPHHLSAPTPCAGWTLARLLAHMEDALDAFTEAASGHVGVATVSPATDRVGALRDKACALLGAWAQTGPATVAVGDLLVGAPLLVETAALEITAHGWDVAQATGRRTPVPDDLAVRLRPVAERVVQPADRGARFAPARDPGCDAGPGDALMAYLGRVTGPVGGNNGEPPSPGPIAS